MSTAARSPAPRLAAFVATLLLGALGFFAMPSASASAASSSVPPQAPPELPPPVAQGAPASGDLSPEQLALQRAELEAEVASQPNEAAPRLRLGDLLARQGDVDAALTSFTKAAELATVPDDLAAAHLAIAILERSRGNADAALAHYKLALQAAPHEPLVLRGIATLLAQLGRYRDAVPYFGLLIAADPKDVGARIGGTTALIFAGEHARARIALEQALADFPDNLDLLDVLARHLAACPDRSVRDGARAIELATRLVDKVPTAESHETLAMAYAEAGDFERAVREQEELIRRFADSAEGGTADRWRANLKLYQAGQPCCANE